jgi:hypothetical protein
VCEPTRVAYAGLLAPPQVPQRNELHHPPPLIQPAQRTQHARHDAVQSPVWPSSVSGAQSPPATACRKILPSWGPRISVVGAARWQAAGCSNVQAGASDEVRAHRKSQEGSGWWFATSK